MKRIFINYTEIDIDQKEQITLNYQCANIGDMRPSGSGSQTIKIPMTAKNKMFFEQIHDINSSSVFPYEIHAAHYYEDETLLVENGNFYVLAVSNVYECCLTWGNSLALKDAENIKVKDIKFGLFTKLNLIDTSNILWQEAGVYTGDINTQYQKKYTTITGELNNLLTYNLEYMRPYFPLITVINKYFEKIGIKFNVINSEIKDIIENNAVLPQINTSNTTDEIIVQMKNKTSESFKRMLFDYTANEITYLKWFAKSIKNIEKNEFTGIGLESFYIPSDGLYEIDLSISYSQNSVGQLSFFQDLGGARVINLANKVRLMFHQQKRGQMSNFINNTGTFSDGYMRHIDTNPVINDETNPVTFIDINQSNVNNLHINIKSDFKKGFYYVSLIGSDPTPLSNYFFSYKIENINIDAKITPVKNNSFNIDLKEHLYLDNNFIFQRENSIKDILIEIFKAFGLFMQLKNNQIELYTPLDIVNNLQYAKDWSKKVVTITKNNYKTLKFEKNIGKINHLKWKEEELYNNLSNRIFNAVSINEESIFLENKIFSMSNNINHTSGLYTPAVDLGYVKYDNNEEILDYNANPKIVFKTGNYYQGYIQVNVVDPMNPQYTNPQYTLHNLQGTYNDFLDYNYYNGVYKFLKPIIDSLKRVKIITCTMVINRKDLQELDFKIPIYLEQFGYYFMLSKISGYKYGGTCDVELLRLEI
ncbi:MAG: hypothetical protein FWC41_12465 [Firmicutes bacterium]|nr:hypothetical protein [Bacillota bacterium]